MKLKTFVFKLWKSSETEKEKRTLIRKRIVELSSESHLVQDPKEKGRKLIVCKLRLL